MIQLVLPNKDSLPTYAAYSQHYDGERKSWSNVLKEGTHPKVYVSKGGHASYFESGESPLPYLGPDEHYGNGVTWYSDDYIIELLSMQKWLIFRGIWGADDGSVQGPVFRHSKPDAGNLWLTPNAYMWVDPIYWSEVI